MKNNVYILVEREQDEINSSLPVWKVIASYDNFPKILAQYDNFNRDKMLLAWRLTEGVEVLCARYGKMMLDPDMNNLSIKFHDLPGRERASLYPLIYDAVSNYMKG